MKRTKNRPLFISCCILLQVVAGLYLIFVIRERASAPPSEIRFIASRSEGYLSLPFDVLQALLALSPEEKKNLSRVDVYRLEQRLLECSAISSGTVRRLLPDTLVVDYTLKKPLFQIGGGHSLLVDDKGSLFRKTPYFPSLSLPILFFPNSETPMGAIQSFVSNQHLFSLCLCIYQKLHELGLVLQEINAEDGVALGFFRREIRVKAHKDKREICIRFPVYDLDKAIGRLCLIVEHFQGYSGVIDLRFPEVGYLTRHE